MALVFLKLRYQLSKLDGISNLIQIFLAGIILWMLNTVGAYRELGRLKVLMREFSFLMPVNQF